MKDYVTIDLNLHPLAWAYLWRTSTNKDYPLILPPDWPLAMIKHSLERQQIITASEIKRQPRNMQHGQVFIPLRDFERHGGYIRLSRQASISLALYRAEMKRLCTLTMSMRLATGNPLLPTLAYYLESEGYPEEVIKIDTLKKYYSRHYATDERAIAEKIKELHGRKGKIKA
ncbi:MAG: hypothetical protein IJU19_09145 [Bacteroidales bacterium]|nr:hypothetical protein [Bacteroidales bacterium]